MNESPYGGCYENQYVKIAAIETRPRVKRRSNGTRAPSSGAIEDISQLLVGEDPRRIVHFWQMMYRQHFWHGNGIVRGTAMSGIDIALWDILGESSRRSVSSTLGRTRARFCPAPRDCSSHIPTSRFSFIC